MKLYKALHFTFAIKHYTEQQDILQNRGVIKGDTWAIVAK